MRWRGEYQYTYVSDRHTTDNPASGQIVSEGDYKTTLRGLLEIVNGGSQVPRWAEDLLRVARAVFLADKRSSRGAALDRWTREIDLLVQVGDPDRFPSEVCDSLQGILGILTSDVWRIGVVGGAPPIDPQGRLWTYKATSTVALYSGGLDSTAYAAEQAQADDGRLLLIGHRIGGARKPQGALEPRLDELASTHRELSIQYVDDVVRSRGNHVEGSTRSRGLLFATTAVFAAAAHETRSVQIPENGQLALNPPLTLGRLAACSTRSVHPAVIHRLNELIAAIGGDVVVTNPLLSLTKGEVCDLGVRNGLGEAELAMTASCGVHSASRSDGGNCGRCYPCLVRRAGLIKALGKDPTAYGNTLGCTPPASRRTSYQNVRDLQRWLSLPFRLRDLAADTPLPDDTNVIERYQTLMRGRSELRYMLDAVGEWVPPPSETDRVFESTVAG